MTKLIPSTLSAVITATYANLNLIFICDITGTVLRINLGCLETLCAVGAKFMVEHSVDVRDNA